MPAPDLNDPVARAAYARELRGVARPVRMAGVWLAVLGAVLAVVRAKLLPMPAAIPWSVLGVAFFLMLVGVSVRMKYHRRRMRGEGLRGRG